MFRREVRQFHIEAHGDKFIMNPSWSLGKYVRTTVVRADRSKTDLPTDSSKITPEMTNQSAPIVEVHNFDD